MAGPDHGLRGAPGSPPPGHGGGVGGISGIRPLSCRVAGELPATHRGRAEGRKGVFLAELGCPCIWGPQSTPETGEEPARLWPSPPGKEDVTPVVLLGLKAPGCLGTGQLWSPACLPQTGAGEQVGVPGKGPGFSVGVGEKGGPSEGFLCAWLFLSCRHCPWTRHFLEKRKHMSPHFLSERKQ